MPVLRTTLSSRGNRSDGRSMSSSVDSPGTILFSTVPTSTKMPMSIAKYAAE